MVLKWNINKHYFLICIVEHEQFRFKSASPVVHEEHLYAAMRMVAGLRPVLVIV